MGIIARLSIDPCVTEADYGYMLADSGSKVVIATDSAMSEVEPALSHPGISVEHRIAIERKHPGWLHHDELLAEASADCPIISTTPKGRDGRL